MDKDPGVLQRVPSEMLALGKREKWYLGHVTSFIDNNICKYIFVIGNRLLVGFSEVSYEQSRHN